MSRFAITYKELIGQYKDLETTSVIENIRIDIQDGKATEETIVYICEVDEKPEDGLFDTDGFDEYPYIQGETYELSDETNSFTLGYVYG